MKQTLEAPYDPGVFLLDGPNVRFTSSEQILSNTKLKSIGSFSIKFQNYDRFVSFHYTNNQDFGFDIDKVTIKTLAGELSITPTDNNYKNIIDFIMADMQKKKSGYDFNDINVRVFVERCVLYVVFPIVFNKKAELMALPSRIVDPEEIITDIIHLPGLRGNPARAYKTSGIGKNFSGTFENYVASIIKLWQQQGNDNLHALCRHLEHVGLTSKVSATALDATQVEIKVGRFPTSSANDAPDLVNIADVGVGVSQTLPVLVALLAAEPGQIVYIEQPEIHLHPLAQYKLAAVIAEASKRGVLVIIETHSDILIRGVQTLVAKGELDPAIVKLHWFSRSPEDGSTTVTCAELDENGAFGDWPQDFDTTILLTEQVYLDAVEQRLFRDAK